MKRKKISIDFIGSRNIRIHFWTTQRIKKMFSMNWDVSLNKEARTRPNSQNHKVHVNFVSERDFIETCMRAVCSMPIGLYKFWIEMFNPDYVEVK